jgi:hypothetical protein
VTPELHGWKPRSLSSEHSNVAPAWFAWKVNVADVSPVSSAGPVRIVVSGGGVTCQLRNAGVESTLPLASIARTRSWCTPTDTSFSVSGETHKLNDPPSTEHWNVEPASLEENVNVAFGLAVSAFGPVSIVVFGAVVSGGAWIVQLQLATVPSVLPAPSVARTEKVCGPTARPA